ncbi:MAG: DUF86 domain-containing protein [Cyanobacteria bacterium P01_F01_bin.143]
MSSRGWSLRVQDILRAINSIQQCTNGMTQTDFESNEMVIQAVLYNLIVIGEASVNIPTDIQERFPELPWRLMRNMRNLIAHQYFRVDSEIIWDTVQNNIPQLIGPLQKLLDSEKLL